MEITIETISPHQAKLMLDSSVGNRTTKRHHVEAIARDMVAGRWKLTGDPIKIDTNGQLNDGHHRLLGCIKANTGFRTAVVRGITPDVHSVLDTGKSRSFADELKMRGEVNAQALAALVQLAWRYDNDRLSSPHGPSRQELVSYLDANPGTRDAIRSAHGIAAKTLVHSGAFSATYFLAGRDVGYEQAEAWRTRLVTDSGFPDGDPVLALRRYATRIKSSRSERPETIEWFALTNKSFNYWLKGRSVAILAWRRGGAGAEDFPRIIADPYLP
jgi:hypothetical protein